MKLTIEQNSRALDKVLRKISTLTGADYRTVVETETQAILQRAVSATDAASISKIRTNAESRDFGFHKTGIDPQKPFTGKTSKNGFKRYYYHNHYPNRVWAALSQQRKDSLKKKLSARGLAKRSWVILAEKLGMTLKVPGYVNKATGQSGPHPENVKGVRIGSGKRFGISGYNASPLGPWTKMRLALNKAITGRRKYFEANLKKGVFNSVVSIARAYPGVVRIK